MSEIYIPINIQREVKRLSNGYCEYCLHPESHSTDYYHFDHIKPLFEGDSRGIDAKSLAHNFEEYEQKVASIFQTLKTASSKPHIIKEKTLQGYWLEHPNAEKDLRLWIRTFRQNQFGSFNELKHAFAHFE